MIDPRVAQAPRPRLLMASRDDPLVPFLQAALQERYTVVGEIGAELSHRQRLLTASLSFRPRRQDWVERFYKSGLALRMRSRNARKALRSTSNAVDVIFQVHALFMVEDPRTVLYVDCTHRQSADQWPAWNPLSGGALRRWYARERDQYQSASHIFVFSRETQASLLDHYDVPPERVTVVGAGVNFTDLPEIGSVTKDAHPTVLFLGNDFARKGGPQLLAAFEIVRKAIPDACLWIAGATPTISEHPGVTLLGRVQTRAEMSTLYRRAHVFCMPSVFEAYGLVLVEAMAHGLPCVSTTTCGVPEIIDEGVTGTMIPRTGPGGTADIDALATALISLLRDQQKATEMGRAGRARVDSTFLWSHVVDRMKPALDKVASSVEAEASIRPDQRRRERSAGRASAR